MNKPSSPPNENAPEGVVPENVELPTPPPVDPETIGADAVKTTADGRKVGWQQPPRPYGTPEDKHSCSHTGAVVARLNLGRRSLGDEWVCGCGQTFVVKIGGGGNKILAKKEDVTDEQVEG